MTRTRAFAAVAVLIVLGGLGAWIALRPAARSTDRKPAATSSAQPGVVPSAGASAHAASPPSATGSALPPPQEDLPAARLHERVDGAEPLLQSLGCQRLRYWRFEQPAADVELLAFTTADGARKALDRDAGSDRTPHMPGDEAWSNDQVVYFRRKSSYVRLIGDDAGQREALVALARRFEHALDMGELGP